MIWAEYRKARQRQDCRLRKINKYTHVMLGKDRAGSAYLQYDLSEVMVFAGALSDANRAAVEDYLIGKYELYGPEDSEITNPKLWLKADAGVTMDSNNLISKWADQSGNGYDATQEIDSGKPESTFLLDYGYK